MPTTTRYLGFTNGIQRLAWSGPPATITSYLWGAGGGRGGSDSRAGGDGTGGGYSSYNFTITDGDVIDVVVGGPGSNGQSGTRGTGGGSAGAGYSLSSTVFNTRTTAADPAVFSYSNSGWGSFLNTYGIWGPQSGAASFSRTYNINFPTTGTYTFTFSVDNYGEVLLDGAVVLSAAGYRQTFQTTIAVTSGTHSLTINATNTGGPGGVALVVTGGLVFSGGRGGNAGGSGSSGGGGGGGGATILLLNGSLVSVAGGGGGGGGGGNYGSGQSAPGSAGQAADGIYAGQDGRDHPGDGGGGGGGGGGLNGGNGGNIPGGDVGGYAGAYGASSAPSVNPTGSSAAQSTSQYYIGGSALGATQTRLATAGLASIVIETTGTNVHDGFSYVPIQQTHIKDGGIWKPVRRIWVNNQGTWSPVAGSLPPLFNIIEGSIGVNSRPWS